MAKDVNHLALPLWLCCARTQTTQYIPIHLEPEGNSSEQVARLRGQIVTVSVCIRHHGCSTPSGSRPRRTRAAPPDPVQAVVPDPGCAHVGQSVQTGCQWDPQQCSGPRNSRCCHWRGIRSGRYIGDIIRAIMAWYPRQTQLYLLIFFKQTVFIPN